MPTNCRSDLPDAGMQRKLIMALVLLLADDLL
ncbi:hypothetical protein P3T39_004257 [Kitasatospora sp. GP82]|nr:hypothetical protein [Kitasatospora sp. GP82]